MTDLRKAAKEALWAFQYHVEQTWPTDRSTAAIAALRATLAQQDEPVTKDMKSAVRWAPSSAYWSQQLRGLFGPDAREGIDALERRLAEAQQAEPHPDYPCRSDGRCQYAIDHGAEGLGSCPKGKCAIAQPQPAEDRAVAQDNLRVMREMFGEQDEPVQEPVAWSFEARHIDTAWGSAVSLKHPGREHKYMRNVKPLYLAPPQRQPLTDEVAALTAQRDALLEALKDATKTIEHLGYPLAAIERARAAIKAVEETK